MVFRRYAKQNAAFRYLRISLCSFFSLVNFPFSSVRPISAQQIFDCNVKIGKLSRAGKIRAARQLFDEMPERDVVSWNAITAAHWKNGNIEESQRMFDLMPVRNVVSWNLMIAGCIVHERMEEACAYFRSMPSRNVASWNAMLSGFVRYERFVEAARLFEEMPERNVISYTAMVDGYSRVGEIERARALFDQIPQKNSVSWTVMISGYVDCGRFEEAKGLFDQMPEKNVVALTAMITCYCKEGKMEDARMMFDGIQQKDLVSWNAIIGGYAQNGPGEEALKLHSLMIESGTRPDNTTMVVVLSACSLLAGLLQGRQIHTILVKSGFDLDISVCNTLITMYSKCGNIPESESVFRQNYRPDLVSWNTIIAAYAQHGQFERALGLFNEMETTGFMPNGITFLNLLSACGHVGKVKESMDLFNSMCEEYDITPRSEHYSCLVDILGRAGQLEKAYDFIKDMPFDADETVWGALLAACHIHLNVDLGRLAAEKLVKLNPFNSGAYVMLSNIYAAAGMWSEVTRIRSLMKEQGVKKQPAYSWMELGSEVHLFSGGGLHPEIDKIHLELEKMGLHMKIKSDFEDLGYE